MIKIKNLILSLSLLYFIIKYKIFLYYILFPVIFKAASHLLYIKYTKKEHWTIIPISNKTIPMAEKHNILQDIIIFIDNLSLIITTNIIIKKNIFVFNINSIMIIIVNIITGIPFFLRKSFYTSSYYNFNIIEGITQEIRSFNHNTYIKSIKIKKIRNSIIISEFEEIHVIGKNLNYNNLSIVWEETIKDFTDISSYQQNSIFFRSQIWIDNKIYISSSIKDKIFFIKLASKIKQKFSDSLIIRVIKDENNYLIIIEGDIIQLKEFFIYDMKIRL